MRSVRKKKQLSIEYREVKVTVPYLRHINNDCALCEDEEIAEHPHLRHINNDCTLCEDEEIAEHRVS